MGILGSHYKIPKAKFYMLKPDYSYERDESTSHLKTPQKTDLQVPLIWVKYHQQATRLSATYGHFVI